MDEEKKARYSQLINSLYSIANKIDESNDKVRAIPDKLAEGLVINEQAYDSNSIISIVNENNSCKNNLYRIIRELKKSMNE